MIEKLVSEDNSLVTTINLTFILKDKDSIDNFTSEIKNKGLNEYYTLNTNTDELENATKSIIIVTHSQNVCDKADVVYELKKSSFNDNWQTISWNVILLKDTTTKRVVV